MFSREHGHSMQNGVKAEKTDNGARVQLFYMSSACDISNTKPKPPAYDYGDVLVFVLNERN